MSFHLLKIVLPSNALQWPWLVIRTGCIGLCTGLYRRNTTFRVAIKYTICCHNVWKCTEDTALRTLTEETIATLRLVYPDQIREQHDLARQLQAAPHASAVRWSIGKVGLRRSGRAESSKP